MFIKDLFAQNFMSYAEVRIDFTKFSGITLIEGTSDATSRGSNGSGKSAIFDIISWVLFGKLVRSDPEIKAGDEVSRFSPDGKVVGMLTLDINGKEIGVTRTRSKSGPSLSLSGISCEGVSSGTQVLLENLIGFTHDLFVQTCMFGGGTSFCSLTDAKKKEMLEEMLGFTRFLEAQEIANAEAKSLRTKIDTLNFQLETCREQRKTQEASLVSHKADLEDYDKEHRDKARELLDSHHDLCLRMDDLFDAVFAKSDEYFAQLDDYNANHDAWEKKVAASRKIFDKAEAKTRELSEALAIARSRIADKKEEANRLKKKEHPGVCPTCGQRWPEKGGGELKTLMLSLISELNKLEKFEAETRHAYKKAKEKQDQCEDDLDAHEEPVHPGKLADYVRAEKQNLKSIEDQQGFSRRLIKGHRQGNNNPYPKLIAQVETTIEELDERLTTAHSELDQLTYEYLICDYWAKAFGRKQLPSFLLDSAVPELNDHALEISQVLTDGELHVYFDPAAKKGASTSFNVGVDYLDGASKYALTSKGEHNRVDLTVLFSIRDLLDSRSLHDTRQVFLDEVFDGLDEEGMAAVLRLLRLRYPHVQFYVITHSLYLKGLCDNVLQIEKKRGVSRVVA